MRNSAFSQIRDSMLTSNTIPWSYTIPILVYVLLKEAQYLVLYQSEPGLYKINVLTLSLTSI